MQFQLKYTRVPVQVHLLESMKFSHFSWELHPKCRGSAIQVLLKCHWSGNSQQPAVTATDLPRPANSPTIRSRLVQNQNQSWEEEKQTPLFVNIVSSQANSRNKFLVRRSPRHLEVGISWSHKHTERQMDIATLWLTQPRGPSQWKQACCAGCRRRPFPMLLHH